METLCSGTIGIELDGLGKASELDEDHDFARRLERCADAQ
jgi:hypothetical protein